MAKAKKVRNIQEHRRHAEPTAGRVRKPPRQPIPQTAQTAEIRNNEIVPVVKSLSSGSASDRELAISKVCGFAHDDTYRFLLLKERIVQKLIEDSIHDPADKVVVGSWEALCVISEQEGYDQSINMYRKDILTQLRSAMIKISQAIELAASNPSTPAETKSQIWFFVNTLVRLVKSLSEASDNVLDAITKLDGIGSFLMGILKPASQSPEDTKAIVVHCLSSITEDNDELTLRINTNSEYLSLLKQFTKSETPLIRICACAILHNASLGPVSTGCERPREEVHYSDASILPILTSWVKNSASLNFSNYNRDTDEEGLTVLRIVVDTISSIATGLGYEFDMGGDNADEYAEDAEAGSDEEDMDEGMEEDMAMVTGSDAGDAEGVEDIDIDSGIVKYIIAQTAPAIQAFCRPLPESLLSLRLRALTAFNNIAWTADLIHSEHRKLPPHWKPQKIWNELVTPMLVDNSANVEVAEMLTSIAWALAKSTMGKVEPPNHLGFMSIYKAAESDALRTNCVGTLGCLARPRDNIAVNREIGGFLIGLVTAAPDTPAEPAIEALNAIFDVYGDKEYTYDDEVFVRNGFLHYLEQAVPGIRTLVKRIDKKKLSELRQKADSALMNLNRFIAYKKKERAKS